MHMRNNKLAFKHNAWHKEDTAPRNAQYKNQTWEGEASLTYTQVRHFLRPWGLSMMLFNEYLSWETQWYKECEGHLIQNTQK